MSAASCWWLVIAKSAADGPTQWGYLYRHRELRQLRDKRLQVPAVVECDWRCRWDGRVVLLLEPHEQPLSSRASSWHAVLTFPQPILSSQRAQKLDAGFSCVKILMVTARSMCSGSTPFAAALFGTPPSWSGRLAMVRYFQNRNPCRPTKP